MKKSLVEIINLQKSSTPTQDADRLCLQVMKKLKTHKRLKHLLKARRPGMIRVVFVGPTKARALNWSYRKKTYVPDVLSFTDDERSGALGEIVLCVAKIRRDAKKNGLSYSDLRNYLIIHGFLHLLGYDHEKPKDERKMMKLQDRLYDELVLKKKKRKDPNERKRRRTTNTSRT